MPVLQPLGDEQAAPEAKEVFGQLQARLRMVPNTFRTMAYAPEVLVASLRFNESFQNGLDPKLRELVSLKASMINNCHY